MTEIDFTQLRPPERRITTLMRSYSAKPKNKFGAPEFVFMHVGKTGGSSINSFFSACHKIGLRVPIVLSHKWSLQMTRLRYPNAKVIVILRDPLERIISGFNSRLRQGGPLGHSWGTDEAIAFSHFNNARMFTDALSSDEHYDISAATYCFQSINHLRRGYRYNFEDLQPMPVSSNRLLHVIRIEDIGDQIPKLISCLNLNKSENIPDMGIVHKAPISSGSFLTEISSENLRKIRERMALEYETYQLIESYIENS